MTALRSSSTAETSEQTRPDSSSDSQTLPTLQPGQEIDLKAIRHPGEIFYFTIIMLFNIIVFTIIGVIIPKSVTILTGIIVLGLIIFAFNKLTSTLLFWFLYGNSVLVSQKQYPEISKAVEESCSYIGLSKIPQIFVLHGAGTLEVFLVKRFSSRGILIFTSEMVDTLFESRDSRQLMMIIGRQLGHIRAGHFKWWFFTDVVGGFTFWIHSAWKRECHFTADRIGFLIASDLDSARRALLSITVGKHLSEETNIEAILGQDRNLRASFFAWLHQISSHYPYMIRRIVELGTFQEHIRQPRELGAKEVVARLPSEISIFNVGRVSHLHDLVRSHRRRLNKLELQAAIHGLSCPPQIQIEIEDIKEEIELLVNEINSIRGYKDKIQEHNTIVQDGKIEKPDTLIISDKNICINCGHDNRHNSRFCVVCGSSTSNHNKA